MRKKIKKMELNTAFVCQFAMDDFKTKYAGSILGLIWAFYTTNHNSGYILVYFSSRI